MIIDPSSKFRFFAWAWVNGIGFWKGILYPLSVDIENLSSLSMDDLILSSKGETVFIIMVIGVYFIPQPEIDNYFG